MSKLRFTKYKFSEIPLGWEVAVRDSEKVPYWQNRDPRVHGIVVEKDDPTNGRGMVRVRLDDDSVIEVRGSDLDEWAEWHAREQVRLENEAARIKAEKKAADDRATAAAIWEAERPAREAAERERESAAMAARAAYADAVNEANTRLDGLGMSQPVSGSGPTNLYWEEEDGGVEAANAAGYYIFTPQQLTELIDKARSTEPTACIACGATSHLKPSADGSGMICAFGCPPERCPHSTIMADGTCDSCGTQVGS